MKNITLFLALAFSGQFVQAQDWTFINPNERYHFQHIDDEIPLNTIFVDSIGLEGTDSIYYLNRLFLECDTCQPEIVGEDTLSLYIDNQPTFLQREIKYYQVSRTVELRNPETYTLQLPGNPIYEWWFDEAKTMKATVHEFGVEEVFGKTDSVVTYAINGEPSITLSKTYGFLKYFDYELKGLENAELGETLPTWKDFYDFEVGDVFQYVKNFIPGGDLIGGYRIEKYVVKNIIKTDESISIHRDGIVGYTDCDIDVDFNFCEKIKDTILIDASLSYYPNELIFVEENTLPYCGNIPVYATPIYEIVEDTLMLRIGANMDEFYATRQSNLFLKNENSTYTQLWGHDYFSLVYKTKLGNVLTLSHESLNYASYANELIGFVKGTDTTGIVYSDEFFTIPEDTTAVLSKLDVKFKVYPNPSSGKLTINLGTETNASIEVYNLQGQLIESFITENNQANDLSYLKAGIYIFSVETKQGIQQAKWIKQ